MVTKRPFGTTAAGEAVTAYTIENARGIAVTLLDYGATIQSLVLPHRGGVLDVALGYDTIGEYERNDGYLGATVGRYAGRIPDAVLRIGGKGFPLDANDGKNHLHGGKNGFDKRVFFAEIRGDAVTFSRVSPDGEEHYPGVLAFSVTYTLDGDTLSVVFRGAADAETCWNPTNHAYWNLNGHGAGDVRAHVLELSADRYMPVGEDLIPVAGEADVTGTRFDFRAPKKIGEAYDHCFILNGGPIRLFGENGLGMEITTDCLAVQLYTAGFLTGRAGKGGTRYAPFGAVCLETQGRQARRNQPPAAESLLNAGESATRTTTVRFLYGED